MHIVSNVWSVHFLIMSRVYCFIIYNVTLYKTSNSVHLASMHQSDITSCGTSSKFGMSSGKSSSIISNSRCTSTWSGCWGSMTGTPWLDCGDGVTGIGCANGVRVASLGISWMQIYPLLSGTVSSSHTGSSKSAVGRDSSLSSESVSGIGGGISLKVRCQQTHYQNGRLLGCLDVKGEIGHWAVLKSVGSKEVSVVNMEYTQIGLVIRERSQ